MVSRPIGVPSETCSPRPVRPVRHRNAMGIVGADLRRQTVYHGILWIERKSRLTHGRRAIQRISDSLPARRERIKNMSDEERQAMRDRMASRRAAGGGQRSGGIGGPGRGEGPLSAQRSQSQPLSKGKMKLPRVEHDKHVRQIRWPCESRLAT